MSGLRAKGGVGIPLTLLAEAETHNVTVELKGGEIYRGTLESSSRDMNVTLSGVTHTARDGRVSKMEQVFLRGSQIRLVVVPDILKRAPVFATVAEVGASAQTAQIQKGKKRSKGKKGGGGSLNLFEKRAAKR